MTMVWPGGWVQARYFEELCKLGTNCVHIPIFEYNVRIFYVNNILDVLVLGVGTRNKLDIP